MRILMLTNVWNVRRLATFIIIVAVILFGHSKICFFFQTKEQGKALLKAIAAKRIEQDDIDPDPEANMSVVHEEEYSSKNDASTMDLTF